MKFVWFSAYEMHILKATVVLVYDGFFSNKIFMVNKKLGIDFSHVKIYFIEILKIVCMLSWTNYITWFLESDRISKLGILSKACNVFISLTEDVVSYMQHLTTTSVKWPYFFLIRYM